MMIADGIVNLLIAATALSQLAAGKHHISPYVISSEFMYMYMCIL